MIIIPLSRHLEEPLSLLEHSLGQGLFSKESLQKMINAPDSYIIGAFEGDQLLGVGIAHIVSTLVPYLSFDHNIVAELENKKIGSISSLCVAENARKRRIGYGLILSLFEWLKQQDCFALLGISWQNGYATSDHLFEKLKFKKVNEVKQFYYDLSVAKNLVCPICAGPCKCSAVLYRFDCANN